MILRRLLILCCLAAALVGIAPSRASADSWLFQRSYYSHSPASPVRIGRRLSGGPYYTRPQGLYVSGGYRNMHSQINIWGQGYDHVNVFESWIQTGGQY